METLDKEIRLIVPRGYDATVIKIELKLADPTLVPYKRLQPKVRPTKKLPVIDEETETLEEKIETIYQHLLR